MLKYRLISFPLLIALVYVLFFTNFGTTVFKIGFPVVIGLLMWDYGKLLEKINIPNFTIAGAVITFIALNAGIWASDKILVILFPLLLVLPWITILINKELFRKFQGTVALFFGCVPFLLLLKIFFWDPNWLLFLICTTKATDTGGYIFGRLTADYLPGGNHKIAPSISPKKSWEGLIGGMLLSVGISCIFFHYCATYTIWWYLVAGVLFSLGSFAGDLTESALKRAAGIKDSGNYIPGMGGVFDVLDSFIYNGLIFLVLSSCKF